jgi:xylulokinase
MAGALDAVRAVGAPVERVLMVGGGAKSVAVQQLAASVLEVPVDLPDPGEYVALGAARQAIQVMKGVVPSP